jgi:FkbM family methyltransferase
VRKRGELVSDRDERLAYFDEADRYTPFLAALAGEALFLVKTEDKHIARSLFSKQGRGEFTVLGRAVAAIEGLLGREAIARRTFVDVGANIGTTTIPALVSHGFASAVAIEPEPENVRVLRLNLLLNDIEDRVKVMPVAVSDELGRSDLVVNPERGGKHWIATDASKLKRKSTTEGSIVSVETVTLDHLAASGVIDPASTGLIWMDAEAHEGHILAGAGSLLAEGTPLVLEWNPTNLDRAGDRERLQRAVADNYTHFAGMHRNPNPEQPSFPLQTVDRLPAYAERFLGPESLWNKTDILVLRLDPEQARDIRTLDAIVKRGGAYGELPEPSLYERASRRVTSPSGGLRRRLSRLRGRTR